LIWVLGYSCGSEDKGAWYPGDNYVDLLGADNYESGPDPDKDLYNRCVEVAPEGMPIVYHECGDIPCEEDMKRVPWLLFMPWHTGWVTGENCGNTPEHFSEIYNSDYFITLDELPDLRNA
jgi:mannan endo-1,4-beta-mannosidase